MTLTIAHLGHEYASLSIVVPHPERMVIATTDQGRASYGKTVDAPLQKVIQSRSV